MNIEIGPSLAAFLANFVTTLGAIVVLWFTQRKSASEVKKAVEDDGAEKKVALGEIHDLVNSQHTEALQQISDLKKTISVLITTPNNGDKAVKKIAAKKIAE